MEYESSYDDELIKQQRVGMEAMRRPPYQTLQFQKRLDKMTRDKFGEKQKLVKPEFSIQISTCGWLQRPMVYVWDPPGQYGVEVKCVGSHHGSP